MLRLQEGCPRLHVPTLADERLLPIVRQADDVLHVRLRQSHEGQDEVHVLQCCGRQVQVPS